MLIDDTSGINITIYYKTGESNQSLRAESDLSKIPEDQRSGYKAVNFIMRVMTWKMSNDLTQDCRVKDPMTGFDMIDWIIYKEKKLKRVIAGWDYRDKNGIIMPVTDELIMKLHPAVAEILLAAYDKQSYLDDAERRDLVDEVEVYVKSASGERGNYKVTPPPEIIEQSLYERFGWSPEVVDRIPLKKLQRMFVVMNQKESSEEAAHERALKKSREEGNKKK